MYQIEVRHSEYFKASISSRVNHSPSISVDSSTIFCEMALQRLTNLSSRGQNLVLETVWGKQIAILIKPRPKMMFFFHCTPRNPNSGFSSVPLDNGWYFLGQCRQPNNRPTTGIPIGNINKHKLLLFRIRHRCKTYH